MTDLPGRLAVALADRYRIERELGAGGMATVYLAEDIKHRRRVAIKVLRPELSATLGPERFVREIEIAANLTHPHILPLFDSGEADGFLYYVMPYIEGESLRERLQREGKLAVDEAIRLTDQVASALSYAHQRGVVHRDIKPENILLAGDQAIVADFGIARAVQVAGGERLTGTGLAVGTPAYMSPEQAYGSEPLDARSDVYSLGCVVYEMVSGGAPFEGPTPQALLAKHAADTVPSLRTSDPEIPLFVDRAVERALAKDPADRFPTASEFAAALTSGITVPRVRTRHTRRGVVMGVAGAVLVVLVVWGLTTLLAGGRIERLAVLPLTDYSGDPEQEFLAAGVHEALIAELGRLDLSVTARATMAQYRDTDKAISEIARELGVDGVIEGSVFRGGDSLEIAARLYDADEQEIWNGTFDGVLSNVVALYRGFARAIAGEIQLSLRPVDQARLGDTRAVNPAVYEAYLRGMHVLNNATTSEDFENAVGYFEAAVEQNPADPLAYTGLAFCYISLGHDFMDPRPEVWPRARAAAERALRLDSTLAEAWAALAVYKTYTERDWEGAELAFRRAHELNPSLADNHYHYAWFLGMLGRVDEALAEHRRAQELDPLSPGHTVWIPALYFAGGDYERALREARINAEQYPQDIGALYVSGLSAARLGLYEEAIAAHEEMAALWEGMIPILGHTYAEAGRTDDAQHIVRELEAQPPTPWHAHGLANIHAALGNRDEALRWLEFEPLHHWVVWSATIGQWEAYREEPRFLAVMRRLNLRFEPGDEYPVPLPIVPDELPSLMDSSRR
jgi:TolB-like protein/tRNA A-37 threonylcarbamoyl transferase component Bud32